MNEKYLLPLFIFGTVIVTSFALITIVFIIIQRQRQVRNRMERQQLDFRYNSELMKTRLEVQEQALLMVSQEIHDNIGQMLSFSCIQLSSLKAYVTGDGREILAENQDLIRQSVKHLRLLSHTLNTGLIEKRALEEAIQTELDRLKAFSTMTCSLEVHGEPGDLTSETRLLIFRIVQEALQNVVKHAAATSVRVELNYHPDHLEMRVCDDGKGLDKMEIQKNATLGMTNMRDRAKMLNAVFSVDSGNNSGTVVSLRIPVNH